MENGLTNDEISAVNNAVDKMKKVGLIPYDDDDDSSECCDDCGCYHGHHPWCGESDEQDEW